MSTASQISPMEVIRPMAEGAIAMVVVSATVHTFGSMVPYVTGASSFSKSSMFSKPAEPSEELESLNKRISRLSYVLENQKVAVAGTREHKVRLMQEYGLGVLPSVAELYKYPKLRMTEQSLAKAEKDLDRMELSMMFLQKRRKELLVTLGMKAEEEKGEIVHYTAARPVRRYR